MKLPKLKPLLTPEKLQTRIRALGRQITKDYQGKDLLCVGILKGAVPFFTQLIQAIQLPLTVDFVCVSSYGNKTKSSGAVRMVLDILQPIAGRHVLLVEDIVDTGVTMSYLLDLLRSRNPASLKIAALLHKPQMLKTKIDIDYLGFKISNEFVVGYGLDYAEKYRNLPFVAVLPTKMH